MNNEHPLKAGNRKGILFLVFVVLLLLLAWSAHTGAQARSIRAMEPKAEPTIAPAALTGEIAYVGLSSDGYSVETVKRIKPDGTGQQTVWTHPGEIDTKIYDVAWKPDGTEIAFSSNHEFTHSAFNSDVYGIRPDGSGLRRITNPPSEAEIKAGDYQFGTVTGQIQNNYGFVTLLYVYVQGATELVSVNAGGSGSVVNFTVPDVADLGTGLHTVTLIWSDGDCANAREFAPAVVDVDAGKTHDIGTLTFTGQCGKYDSNTITWKSDGLQLGVDVIGPRKFAAVGESLGTDLFGFGATFADNIAWSPIDDRILYFKSVPNGSDNGIYVATAGSSTPTGLIDAGGYLDLTPVWLPDGSGFIIATSQALFHYDFDSKQVTPFLDSSSIGGDLIDNPSVSPDGNYVVFERLTLSSPAQYNLWIVNRTNPSELFALTSDGRSMNPDWSRVEPSVPDPTNTPTVLPTETPIGEPTATPVGEPTTTPVGEPTETPVGEPTATPVGEPTETPVGEPTATPVGEPTETPVGEPTTTPVGEPTATPVGEPTATPVGEPTATPVGEPTETPVSTPNLELNFNTGKAGSRFVLSGSNFGSVTSADIMVNREFVVNVSVNNGSFTLVLITASDAQAGVYQVDAVTTEGLAADETLASMRYTLDADAPLREEQPPETTSVDVPASIAPMEVPLLYLPLVQR